MKASSQRIELVEQLRGLAALAVAWFHLTNGYSDWVARTGSHGWLGVEVFFVVSGMVIPLSLVIDWHQRGLRAIPLFLVRRAVRIEPPYLFSVLLVVALNSLAMRAPGFQGQMQTYPAEQVLLHAAYLIPFSPHEWLQPVYWTLAFEFAFYIAVASMIGVVDQMRQKYFLGLVALVLALVVAGKSSPLVALFVMGCVVFRARASLTPLWLAGLGLLACVAAMSLAGAAAQSLIGLMTAVVLLSERHIAPLAARIPLLGNLGALSFSLYLLHVPIGGKIVNLGRRWLTSPLEHLLLSGLALAGSLLAAYCLWRWVERPCIAASRRLAYAWRDRAEQPGAT